jgi:hypothetical protein
MVRGSSRHAHQPDEMSAQLKLGLNSKKQLVSGRTVLEQRSRTATGPKHVFVKWARWGSECHKFDNSLSELASQTPQEAPSNSIAKSQQAPREAPYDTGFRKAS